MSSDARFEPGFRKTVRWTLFTAGGIIVIMGLLCALNPILRSPAQITAMGVGLLVSGLNYFVPYFALKNSRLRPKWLMLLGVADAAFGVLFISRVVLLLFKPLQLTGIWLIFVACLRVYMAFVNFRERIPAWWITLTVSACMLVAAAVMMSVSADTALAWCALIITGVFVINEGRKLFGK
jgi:uncharacterized membrane protein HdeD (DUF308 family)